jgi:hypothetical protein
VIAVASRYDWQEVASRYGTVYESAIRKDAVVSSAISSGAAS